MLSAIVTRVAGQTLHQFLTPRLFAPLGIERVRWDIGPDGFNPGGNGISLTTTDALKIGILHERKGVWDGRRILSESWVERATRAQGAPGYGYHWVVGDHYYAALGIFVQMITVYPESQAVVVVTGAMEESKVLLPHLKSHFPAAFGAATDGVADQELARRLADWREPPAIESAAVGDIAALAGSWTVEPNAVGVTRLSLAFADGSVELAVTDRQGEHRVKAKLDGWVEAPISLPAASLHHGYALDDAPALAGARWADGRRLELVLHFAETAFRDTLTLTVEDERMLFERKVNINSGDRAWPGLTARRH
jgi:hypothetical protein